MALLIASKQCFYFALYFLGISFTTGNPVFSHKPDGLMYFREGSDAVFAWNYNKTDSLFRVLYEVKNKTTGLNQVLRLEDGNGAEIQDPSRPPPAYAGRLEKRGRATLVVKSITFEDSTSFRCALIGKPGFADSDSNVNLVVTGPCALQSSVQATKFGGSAVFTCNATGVPAQNFSWTRQGETKRILSDDQHSVSSIEGSSQLTVKNISIGDQGFYVCDATVNNNQPCSASGYIQALYSKVDSCPTSPYNITIGGSLTLHCPVSGYPPPIVTWKKNGTERQIGEDSKFTIMSAKEEDLGIYTCMATDGENTLVQCNISVMKEIVELSVIATDGTPEEAANLTWSQLSRAEYYVVKITGNDLYRDDFVIGSNTSLELHYHTFVLKEAGKKPDEIAVCADVTAIGDKGVVGKSPTCQKLTIKSNQVTVQPSVVCLLLMLSVNWKIW